MNIKRRWVHGLAATALFCLPLTAFAAGGDDAVDANDANSGQPSYHRPSAPSGQQPDARGRYDESTEHDADNTGRNVRDRNDNEKTSFDQGSSQPERELAATIRREIVNDDSLSTYAHNIKIIVNGTTVTLRGPVNNPNEFHRIQEIVKRTAGVEKVDNQLEVTTKDKDDHKANRG